MNLTSGPHACFSGIIWYKPNSLNSKSIYNTLLLEFYICAKPRSTHWHPCPKKVPLLLHRGVQGRIWVSVSKPLLACVLFRRQTPPRGQVRIHFSNDIIFFHIAIFSFQETIVCQALTDSSSTINQCLTDWLQTILLLWLHLKLWLNNC